MIDTELLAQLKRIVGSDYVAAGPTDTEVYSYDASLAVAVPDAVVLPADTEQTAAIVRTAAEAGVPCVPRGFGTNLSGGSDSGSQMSTPSRLRADSAAAAKAGRL